VSSTFSSDAEAQLRSLIRDHIEETATHRVAQISQRNSCAKFYAASFAQRAALPAIREAVAAQQSFAVTRKQTL
jgi:hypothetical protein